MQISRERRGVGGGAGGQAGYLAISLTKAPQLQVVNTSSAATTAQDSCSTLTDLAEQI